MRRARDSGIAVELVLAGKEEHRGEEAALRSLAAELGLNGAVRFDGVVEWERLAGSTARQTREPAFRPSATAFR